MAQLTEVQVNRAVQQASDELHREHLRTRTYVEAASGRCYSPHAVVTRFGEPGDEWQGAQSEPDAEEIVALARQLHQEEAAAEQANNERRHP